MSACRPTTIVLSMFRRSATHDPYSRSLSRCRRSCVATVAVAAMPANPTTPVLRAAAIVAQSATPPDGSAHPGQRAGAALQVVIRSPAGQHLSLSTGVRTPRPGLWRSLSCWSRPERRVHHTRLDQVGRLPPCQQFRSEGRRGRPRSQWAFGLEHLPFPVRVAAAGAPPRAARAPGPANPSSVCQQHPMPYSAIKRSRTQLSGIGLEQTRYSAALSVSP